MPFMPRWVKNKPRNISDIIAFLESGVATSPSGEPTELASPLLDAEASAVAQEEYMLARVSQQHSEDTVTTLIGTKELPKLHLAAVEGDFETAVCELVLAGSDVNSTHTLPNRNNDLVNGVTPLYLAAQEGHYEMCRLLLKRGADARAKCRVARTGECFSPADVALTQGNFRTWWMLTKAMKRQDSSGELRDKAADKGAASPQRQQLLVRQGSSALIQQQEQQATTTIVLSASASGTLSSQQSGAVAGTAAAAAAGGTALSRQQSRVVEEPPVAAAVQRQVSQPLIVAA